MNVYLEEYRDRLNDQLENGESDDIEHDACALAAAVVHAMTQLERHKLANTLTPDTAGDLLDDLRHLVAGVL